MTVKAAPEWMVAAAINKQNRYRKEFGRDGINRRSEAMALRKAIFRDEVARARAAGETYSGKTDRRAWNKSKRTVTPAAETLAHAVVETTEKRRSARAGHALALAKFSL